MNRGKTFFQFRAAVLVFLVLILAACQTLARPVPTRVSIPTPSAVIPVTGQGPSVSVNDQVSDGSQVVVADVFSVGPGWMAIHKQENGQVGPAIGHAPIQDGENKDVVVTIDPNQATEVMYAMLHIDAGEVGVYEFPGADVPELADGQILSPPFQVTLSTAGESKTAGPEVIVADQEVKNGSLTISKVFSSGPGWLVIYDNHGGKLGDPIGYSEVKAGENSNLTVAVNPNHISRLLYARLHVDAGEKGTPEFPSEESPNASDIPAVLNGQEIVITFQNLSLPPDEAAAASPTAVGTSPTAAAVTPAPSAVAEQGHDHGSVTPAAGQIPLVEVSDQDVQDGTVEVIEIFSPEPGWVAIYTDKDGEPDQRLGFAPVQAGENQNVVVPVDASKVTLQLHAILHQDTGQIGTFDFPNADPPVHVDIRMVKSIFRSNTETAQATQPAETALTVIAMDQPLRGGNTLIIPEVVSDGPGWVGIHLSNPDGTLSHTAAIGAGKLNDGVNTNVVVRLVNPARATEKLWAMLHVDKGTIGEYEFPNPPVDVPVHDAQGEDLVDDFLVTSGLAGQNVLINVAGGGESPYLVDAQGFSLYTLSLGDCNDECLKNWLPLLVTGGKVEAGPGADGRKLGIVGLGNGNKQVTYGTLPLYYYIGDFKPGDTNGQGLDGQWFLARP